MRTLTKKETDIKSMSNNNQTLNGAGFDFFKTAKAIEERSSSPHLLDLKKPNLIPDSKINTRKKLPAKWRMMLNERIYLKDMRYRSVSIRPRGWRDLPPDKAKNLWHAVKITGKRFFNEHPLADLTLLMVVHTCFLIVWRIITAPTHNLHGLKDEQTNTKAILPIMPVSSLSATPKLSNTTFNIQSVFSARFRTAFAYAGIALMFMVPIGALGGYHILNNTKESVMQKGLLAIDYLKNAGVATQSNDFNSAKEAFSLAEAEFSKVKNELGLLSGLLSASSSILPSTKISSAGLMLIAGEELSEGGKYFTNGLANLTSQASPIDRLRGLNADVNRAIPHLQKASHAITMMSAGTLPQEHRETLDKAKIELPRIVADIKEASNMAGFLTLMLGSENQQRYLVVFQNNSEIRPTGGFIGSFALLDVNKGEITNFEMPGGGSYDLQGSLTAKLMSPKPLRLINPHWEFQDANWSPDFPTSAERLAWFYEKSGGPTVDGVIAINATVMEKLLDKLGPVSMPDYNVTLSADNFIEETQREVEINYDKELNKPKQILSDMAPIILEKIMSAQHEDYISLATLLNESLSKKDMQLWFVDNEMQSKAMEFGWTGQIKNSSGDYLQVVHTNIAGQKTDLVMQEKITHDIKILADGSAIVNLTISRTHNGIKGEEFTGVRNVDYLRVYVPLGSNLIEARGFNIPDPKLFSLPDAGYISDPQILITENSEKLDRKSGTKTFVEHGKTVFGNWVQTEPGETSEVTFVYQLPPQTVKIHQPTGGSINALYKKLTQSSVGKKMSYNLLLQKQSGTNPIEFVSRIDLPRSYNIIWESPEYEEDERGRNVASLLITDDMTFSTLGETLVK